MHNETDWKSRLRAAFGAQDPIPDDDVLEELAAHAQSMYEAALAAGCSRDEADKRMLGQIELWRSDAALLRRSSNRRPSPEPPPSFSSTIFRGLLHDITYAARLLRRESRYALLSILTMAFGIGLTVTLFNVTYGVLMKPLPWRNADRLVVLGETRGGRTPRFGSFTNAVYNAWREQMTKIDDIAAWSQRDATLAGAGDPERIRVVFVTASLFRVLGVDPLLGATFVEKDESERVLVLSKSLWQTRFGGGPQVLGKVVRLDGQPYRIIGVLDDALAFPDRQGRAWAPMRVQPVTGTSLSIFNAIAAGHMNATAAEISAEGTFRGGSAPGTGLTTKAIFGSNGPIAVSARPLRDALTTDVRKPLVVLLIAVALLFATATANVAGLQMVRATTRRREIAIRAAIGADSVRLARELVVENLLLSLSGGLVSLGFAWGLHRSLPFVLPADFPRIGDVTFNTAVVLLALLASISVSLICGFLPSLYVRRLHLNESLAENGATAVGPSKRSRTMQARRLIMSSQVAIACVLLVSGSLLVRSFIALLNADRGFKTSSVLTARLSLPEALYTPERRYAVLDDILHRLAPAPGLTDASFTSELPLTPGGSTAALTMKASDGSMTSVQASPRLVSPRYFAAIGMRITEGRAFSEGDTQTSPPVAIVNRSFARRYLNDMALGANVPMGVGYQDVDAYATIVGIVDDVRYVSPSESTQPEVYYSYLQLRRRLTTATVTVIVRTSGNSMDSISALRTAVREADRNLAADAISTLEERMVRGLARPRLYAILLGGFAVFALIVASVGLFSVLSYVVAQRSREFALRAALGARRVDIVRQVIGQGMAITAAGLAAGLLGSVALVRSIAAMLYGVSTHDAVTFIAAPVLLLSLALVASLAPALRAARIDPIRLLKA